MGLFGRRPKHLPEPDPARRVRLRRGTGDLEVMGERYHAKSLKHVWKLAEDTDHVVAALVPEPGNPHDPHAVRVDLLQSGIAFPAGYLPRQIAPGYSRALRPLSEAGFTGVGQAKLWKGTNGFQVYVKVSDDPEALVPPRIEDPEGVFVDGLFDLTVTGEEEYQDLVSGVARTQRTGLLFGLEEATISKGKYKGEGTFAVTLHGRRIGALTRAMTVKHAPVIEPIMAEGKRPYLLGRLEQDHRGWQAVLQAPPAGKSGG